METISNIASSATTTVSNLIYGQPAQVNETAGKEPVSGQQGKGTAQEPFDQGNAENLAGTSSSASTFPETSKNNNTSSQSDDFLKLSPAVGKPSLADSATETRSGPIGDTAIPIVPLNPDVATSGGTTSTSTTGNTDSTWKETSLDNIKRSGAPGAGPSAPDYTPAVPDLNQTSSAPSKEHVSHEAETIKPHPTAGTFAESATLSKEHASFQGSSATKKESVSSDIDAIIHPTPKADHSVDDAEANDLHSKMAANTVHHTGADKPSTASESKGYVAENTTHKHVDSKAPGPASPAAGEEKDSKMSGLKDKLKNKLHIGSKDK